MQIALALKDSHDELVGKHERLEAASIADIKEAHERIRYLERKNAELHKRIEKLEGTDGKVKHEGKRCTEGAEL